MWSTNLIQTFALLTVLPQVINAAAVSSTLLSTVTAATTASEDTQESLLTERSTVKQQPGTARPGTLNSSPTAHTHIHVDGRREDRVDKSHFVGEPHGTPFDDAAMASDHKRIKTITLTGCDHGFHLSYIALRYRSAEGHEGSVEHGTSYINAVPRSLTLDYGERVTKVEVTTWRKKVGTSHRTRVGWIKFHTSKQRTLECGSKNEKDVIHPWFDANFGESLLYFTGSAGQEIDQLQGVFIPNTDV